MNASFLPSLPLLRRLPLALCLSLPLTAQATLPAVEVLVNFTGSQAGGGNGAYPDMPLSEAQDGYLYSRTKFGGGTEADMQNNNQFGNYGGRPSAFYRIRPDGTGFEVLARPESVTTIPSYASGWLAASDGYLYAPSTGAGILHRYLPGSGLGWEFFGTYTNSSSRADVVAEANGRFVVGRLSTAFRSVSLDGTTATALPATYRSNVVGSAPTYITADTDGTMYIVFRSGGGYGNGALTRLDPAGTAYTRLCGFSSAQLGNQTSNDLPASPIVLQGDYVYGVLWNGPLGGGTFWRIRKDGTGDGSFGLNTCANVELLHTFSGNGTTLGGRNPAYLSVGADGNIYGISSDGIALDGSAASGAIWRYRFAQEEGQPNVMEVLHTFSSDRPDPPRNNVYLAINEPTASTINTGANAGGHTISSLRATKDGRLYGTTQLGGSHGWGTVFRFEPGDEVPAGSILTPVPPTVAVSTTSLQSPVTRQTVVQGDTFTLYWLSTYAADCTASTTHPDSSWNGARPPQGRDSTTAERITVSQLGTWQYTLTCKPQSAEMTDPISASVTIDVVPQRLETEQVGNDGGGSLPAGLFSLLPLLGLSRRRRR